MDMYMYMHMYMFMYYTILQTHGPKRYVSVVTTFRYLGLSIWADTSPKLSIGLWCLLVPHGTPLFHLEETLSKRKQTWNPFFLQTNTTCMYNIM